MLNMNCRGCQQRFLPLPDLSRKIEGDSVRMVRIVMPMKHHFGKSEWLKINLIKTMHSFCHFVFRKAYFCLGPVIVYKANCVICLLAPSLMHKEMTTTTSVTV